MNYDPMMEVVAPFGEETLIAEFQLEFLVVRCQEN